MKADGLRNTTAVARVQCRPETVAIALAGGEKVRMVSGKDGMYVIHAPGDADAELAPVSDAAGGWVLGGSGSGGFSGRTTPLEPDGAAGDGATILTGDGRVFRSVAVVDDDPRIELRGWETSGAYLVAHREPDGWRIEATPAGLGLSPGHDLLVLWIAHLTEPRPVRGVRGET